MPPTGDTFNASAYLLDARLDQGDGDRLAITGPGGDLTYRELLGYVCELAAGLRGLGVRPEERVVLFMADGAPLAGAFLAALRIGAVPVPVSTMATGAELAVLLRDTRTRVLVVSGRFAPTVRRAVREAPELVHLVVDGDLSGDEDLPVLSHPLGDLADGAATSSYEEPYGTVDDSPGFWLYTSGTTGTPKGAMHRHAGIRHVAETYGRQVLGITPEDRCFSVPKLFFAYGLGNSLLFPLSVGATSILDAARPTPATVAERLLDDRPTLFFAVPTFYAALLSADVPAAAFESVRLAVSAGEPLPAELYRRFTERYGVELIDGLGSTEALHIFLSNRPGEVRPGTTGRPVPGYELRLVDSGGADVGAGNPGSLLVKGESIATGYWCRTGTTRRVFEGEWLRTGDTYVADADGYYTCLGRTDDMLKAGGIWVSPTEVEGRLTEHPAVALAAVVGVPDETGIVKPVACVVPQDGAAVTPGELVEFCRAGLAAYKRPREVLIVGTLPTTATGKLRRFAVREQAAALLAERRRAEDSPADPAGV